MHAILDLITFHYFPNGLSHKSDCMFYGCRTCTDMCNSSDYSSRATGPVVASKFCAPNLL